MLFGVVSDIHANRIALASVLDDMPETDAIVCAGDVVGYNPWPADCIEELRDRDVPTVMGNHDRAVVTGTGFAGSGMADAGARYAADVLESEHVEWLQRLPDSRYTLNRRIRLVHGHPDDPNRYTYPSQFSADLLGEEDVLVMGHTHVQGHKQYDDGIVLNPGSVGQPRDGDPRAAYALVDLDSMSVSERRVEYDIEAVIEAIEEAGLPKETGTRLRKGR